MEIIEDAGEIHRAPDGGTGRGGQVLPGKEGLGYDFLYYIRQRSAHADRLVASSEMALLGYHLKHKLFPDEEYDVAMVDEGYTLYDLAGKGADQLTGLVRTLMGNTMRDGKRHSGRMPFADHKKGTTFISFPAPTSYSQLQKFKEELTVVALTHKYMSQADEWMALASITGSPVSFDIFGYIKSPWQEDPQMDELVEKSMIPGIPIHPDGTMPSKNRSCPCGSGRKFKRCHGRQNLWQ